MFDELMNRWIRVNELMNRWLRVDELIDESELTN